MRKTTAKRKPKGEAPAPVRYDLNPFTPTPPHPTVTVAAAVPTNAIELAAQCGDTYGLIDALADAGYPLAADHVRLLDSAADAAQEAAASAEAAYQENMAEATNDLDGRVKELEADVEEYDRKMRELEAERDDLSARLDAAQACLNARAA